MPKGIYKHKCGSSASGWRGGITHDSQGYVLIRKRNHPKTNYIGYVKRAILVMEKKLERYLESKEIIHHINGIKDDDQLENLMLFPNESEHAKYHYPKGAKLGINNPFKKEIK